MGVFGVAIATRMGSVGVSVFKTVGGCGAIRVVATVVGAGDNGSSNIVVDVMAVANVGFSDDKVSSITTASWFARSMFRVSTDIAGVWIAGALTTAPLMVGTVIVRGDALTAGA